MQSIFLGNARPLLHLTAEYLIRRFYKDNQLEMRSVLLTFQEKRAVHRLEEILAKKAEEIDPAWYPPEFLTIGTLPEKLYELKREIADEPTQCFAWLAALDQLHDKNPDFLQRLLPSPPRRDDLEARFALGRMFAKLHRELAAGTLDCIFVANLCRNLKIEYESDRWQVLGILQEKYLAILDSLKIWDVQSARLFALNHPELFEPRHTQFQQDGTQILLVGVVDMNLAQKEMLRHFGDFVTPLVFAPEDWSERFDDLGCLIPHVWQDAHIKLDDRQIHIVESAGDQADEVMRCLTEQKGKYAPPEIIVGVPDKQIIPFIEQSFERANTKTRIVAGRPIQQTSVFRFLETLLPFLESPTFAHFASLVRHPDVETFLRNKLAKPVNLLAELDRYHTEFLPAMLTEPQSKNYGSVDAIHQHLQTLLASQDLAAILRTLFSEHSRDEAFQHVLDTLAQIQVLQNRGTNVPRSWLPPLSFPDTLRLVLTLMEKETISMPEEPNAVELIGWLDLAMDDAEVIIVTGMNDGHVPEFQMADMFLPDTMRQQLSRERKLSIEDNSRRYARDAYALTCILTTRQNDPQRTYFIGSRRSVEGDPMLPSRLFFADDDETVTKRVRQFFAEHRELPPKTQFIHEETKPCVVFKPPEIPENAGQEIKEMNVTEFAKYKRCPYRYYLECRLDPKLQVLDDENTELDAAAFGTLIHQVLETFGQEPLKHSTSADEIRDFLVQAFREEIRNNYGEQPRPVVAIQAERAIKRLEAFAHWQADWAREYEIVETELRFGSKLQLGENQSSLDVDGKEMFLRGRIDRIDLHKRTNELIIWDYKTSNFADPKRHLKNGEWIDFQLPLYYHLLSQHKEYSGFLRKGFRLGFIVLPADVSKTGDLLADWDHSKVLSAIDEARNIVRDIWSNKFAMVSPPPPYSEAFAAICNDF